MLHSLLLLNAGSLMFWFGCLHLIIGNLFIAVFEYLFADKVYHLNLKIGPIIIANYLSMFFGLFIIAPEIVKAINNELFWMGSTQQGHYDFTGFAIGMKADGVILVNIYVTCSNP